MQNFKKIYRHLACVFILIITGITGITGSLNAEIKAVEVKWEGSSSDFKLFAVQNERYLPEYYYADLFADDKRESVVRVYWDSWGEYLKFGIKEGNHLTKINGESFSLKDMEKLHLLLNNKNADIKHYKMSDLSVKEAEVNYYSVDAVSGATVVESSYECVDGAVKICFNLWHKVHGKAMSVIKNTTLKEYEKVSGTIHQNDAEHLSLLIDKISKEQKITAAEISNMKDLSNHTFVWYSTLIHEIRQSQIFDKDINTKLNNLLLKPTSGLTSLLFYNFLTDRDFRSKEVRQFTPDFKVL